MLNISVLAEQSIVVVDFIEGVIAPSELISVSVVSESLRFWQSMVTQGYFCDASVTRQVPKEQLRPESNLNAREPQDAIERNQLLCHLG